MSAQPTIQEVIQAIKTSETLSSETQEKYVKQFRELIKNCNNSNFIDRCNDTEYIKFVYLGGKAASTINTYISELLSINRTKKIMTKETADIIDKYRYETRRNQDLAKAKSTKEAETASAVMATESENTDISLDELEPIEELTTLQRLDIKIQELQIEIQELQMARSVIFKYDL